MKLPLALAVIELRFPESAPLTQLQVQAIKESLALNLPIYKFENRPLITSAFSTETMQNTMEQTFQEVHHFMDRTKESGVSLTSQSLLVETTKYQSWDSLKELFKQALESVLAATEIVGFERLGCRYIDEFRREVHESQVWSDWISQEMLPMDFSDSNQPLHLDAQMFQAVYSGGRNGTTATLRYGLMKGGPVIGSGEYLVRVLPDTSDPEFFLLDADCAWQLPPGEALPPLDVPATLELADSLHDLISLAFKRATTPLLQRNAESWVS